MERNSALHADKDVKILIPEDVKIVKLTPRQQQEAKGAARKSLAALVGIEMFRRPRDSWVKMRHKRISINLGHFKQDTVLVKPRVSLGEISNLSLVDPQDYVIEPLKSDHQEELELSPLGTDCTQTIIPLCG